MTDDLSLGGHSGLRNVCIKTILIEELILHEDIFVCTCHSISYKKLCTSSDITAPNVHCISFDIIMHYRFIKFNCI